MNANDKYFIAATRMAEAKSHLESAINLMKDHKTVGAARLVRTAMCRLADAMEEIVVQESTP